MSLSVCIPELVAQGKIPKGKARDVLALFDEIADQYEGEFGRAAAEAMATERTLKQLENALREDSIHVAMSVRAQAAILDNAKRVYAKGAHADGPVSGAALLAHLAGGDDKANGIISVEYLMKVVKGEALSRFYDLLSNQRANVLGQIRNRSDLKNVLRELHGEDTGDLNARELAEAWRAAAEYLRRRFNAAGGAIGKLSNWGVPQSHDAFRVGAVLQTAWIDYVMPRLDRMRMLDGDTGLPFSDGKLREVLADVYDTIVSEGYAQEGDVARLGQRPMWKRYSEHRFLHFKSADDWMAYQERFGGTEPLDAMMGHVHVMSRDIAMMEVLGPNPKATVAWMKGMIAKDAMVRGTVADRLGIGKGQHSLDVVFDYLRGENNRVVSPTMAMAGASLRNWQTATKLGSAVISSLTDTVTSGLTHAYNGLPVTGMMRNMLGQFNPLSRIDREMAERAGIVGEEFLRRVSVKGRDNMEELFGGRLEGDMPLRYRAAERANALARRLADGVIRFQGLNFWTQAMKKAFYQSAVGTMSVHKDVTFDALPGAFRGFLERGGIDARGWDVIRSSETMSFRGKEWIDTNRIADEAVRTRLMAAIRGNMDYAVPEAGARINAAVTQLKPGTFAGEAARTLFQFKGFAIATTAMHLGRAMAQGNIATKGAYGVTFLAGVTLMGTLVEQLQLLKDGKDPRSFKDWSLYSKGFLRGGGAGIYGDLIKHSSTEFGQGWEDVIAGPGLQTLWTVGSLTGGAVWDAYDPDKDVKYGERLARALKSEVPGSSLWYVRAPYNRMWIDTVMGWANDDYIKSQRRLVKRAEKENTGYWYQPGDFAPRRAPNFANAFSSPPEE